MRLPKATHGAVMLLVAAALSVNAHSGAQAANAPKSNASKSRTPSKSAARPKTAASSAKSATASKPASVKSSSKTRRGRVTKTSSRVRGQKAPEASRITEIQQALSKDGSFTGTPNGKWDDTTVAAMKKYQEAHGLNPTGKLDAKTLQNLGLGSQTAGVAAPMPPVSSSSLSTAPSASPIPRDQ